MHAIRSSIIFLAGAWALTMRLSAAHPSDYLVYFGTYTGKNSKGIYMSRYHVRTGKLGAVELAAQTENPSWLTADPSGRFLFAANETGTFKGAASGSVSSFAIDPRTGKLKALSTVASRGADPCYLAVDPGGKYVLAANYTGGSVAVLPVAPDGKLGEASAVIQHHGSSINPDRQREPHAHFVTLTPDNRLALAADLGLDKLLVYHFDSAKGTLTANDPPSASVKPGSGPRHLAFHPKGEFAYVINEMANTITAFHWDGTHGSLNELQTISTLPAGFTGENSTAEIAVHPSGRFLYGSNRRHDSIAVFAIDPVKGTLTFVEDVLTEGKEPRNFALDPAGAYLLAANQNSNDVTVFRLNAKNGRLAATGQKLTVPSPVCITFVKTH